MSLLVLLLLLIFLLIVMKMFGLPLFSKTLVLIGYLLCIIIIGCISLGILIIALPLVLISEFIFGCTK